jgi:3'-5' exoribonuclease
MKDIYIADLANFDEGKLFDGFFLVLSKQQRTTKNNKPYLNLILGDKTGQLEGRVWEPATRASPRTSTRRHRQSPRQRLPLRRPPADEDRPAPRALPARSTSPTCCPPPPTTWPPSGQLLGLCREPHQSDLKRLLTTMLDDPALAQAYREAPAAKQLHHAWLGGLLEHVVSLCTLADRVAPHYPLLDRDLLLTGVILHDIGKVRELSWEIGFEYTIEGMLLGHIQMGAALPKDHRQPAHFRRRSRRWSCT